MIRTTYAVSAKFVIKESIGTGFVDSNLKPKISKSFFQVKIVSTTLRALQQILSPVPWETRESWAKSVSELEAGYQLMIMREPCPRA